MSCSNCYNGCSEIISDKCVRYTGIDIPLLGIQNGDSLSYVEQTIIGFLSSTLDGTGIKVDIPQTAWCALVSQYLPTCGDLTVVDVLTALVKAACDLQAQIVNINSSISNINSEISTIEADYDIKCLTGVSAGDGTHAVLQATINQLCAFIIDVEANYVLLTDIDNIIAEYLANQPTNTKVYSKMVPYIAYEFYGSLTNFDTTGAGTGDWEKIYLCNGLNGTPDKRGVVTVGAIVGVPGGPLSPVVNPLSSPFNPNYALGAGITGSNSITLTDKQIPSHTHANTLVFTNPDHTHFTVGGNTSDSPVTAGTSIANVAALGGNSSYQLAQGAVPAVAGLTSPSKSALTINLTNVATGGDLPHANNQPAIASYYIMYIP